MNGCIILFGESFRFGGQGNRNRGSDKSYGEQIKAANSHVSFIKDLNSKNVNIDVYISSYETKFKNDLLTVYKDILIGYDFYEDLIGQEKLIHNAMSKITNIDKYDFLLIMRVDLFLKEKFTQIFHHKWDKIMWPSICFKPHHKCGIHPRVNDMMIFFPKKYYKYLQHIHFSPTGHSQWADFINKTNLKYNDLHTILNTFHDSDSAKDFNPIYYIVNRKQSNIHHSKGHFFDKEHFK